LVDIVFETRALGCIPHPAIHEALLPNRTANTEPLTSFMGKSAFDELHDSLQGDALRHGHQQVHMIGHNHESMNCELPILPIPKQCFAEQLSHPVRLQYMDLVEGPSGYEIGGTRGFAAVRDGHVYLGG
jgi:hypothetical protein